MGNYILGPNGDFVSVGELYHYGIKGMKWGVRRYQNKDGSLTPAGKKRLVKSITSKKMSTIDANEYAKEAVENIRGFKNFKRSDAYRAAKRHADEYRGYKETYRKMHDKIYRDAIASVEKKYGRYEDLERNSDVISMKKFDDDFKKAMDDAYKKNDLYAIEEGLVRKYERVMYDRAEIEGLARAAVENVLGTYGDKPLRGVGSAIYSFGRVIDRAKVKDVVNQALTEDVTKNTNRPFNGWEIYRYNNKTREQQLKDLDSEFRTRMKKAERDGNGAYADLILDQWYLAHDEYDSGEIYPRTIREHIDVVDESWEWITNGR